MANTGLRSFAPGDGRLAPFGARRSQIRGIRTVNRAMRGFFPVAGRGRTITLSTTDTSTGTQNVEYDVPGLAAVRFYGPHDAGTVSVWVSANKPATTKTFVVRLYRNGVLIGGPTTTNGTVDSTVGHDRQFTFSLPATNDAVQVLYKVTWQITSTSTTLYTNSRQIAVPGVRAR